VVPHPCDGQVLGVHGVAASGGDATELGGDDAAVGALDGGADGDGSEEEEQARGAVLPLGEEDVPAWSSRAAKMASWAAVW
tara:strand:- start:45 stop:287 length:243 start_codon:yes stop_codon:yes gene_type:complete